MSITSFASYINCPYQFYLERVAKVYPVSDDLVELDALGFGTLAHDVLAAAARDPGFNSSDANIVRDLLFDTLEDFNRRLFSRNSLPAVKIQIDQLKGRLQRMIDWQVVQRRDGWRTFSVERDLSDLNVFVETSGDPMRITGRIDRIDVNDSTGNYMILDYKTSDRGRDKSDICAEKKIEGHEEKQIVWSDLQVPLYLLAGKLLLANEKKAVGFGYINLSAQTYHQIYEPLDVVDIEYKSGITQASAIADLVRKQVFWPPNSRRVMDPERDPYWRLLAGLSEQVEQLAGEEIDV
jgi:ATP-dependent helicase/DNAse subunit B